jgi:hypothetical protein
MLLRVCAVSDGDLATGERGRIPSLMQNPFARLTFPGFSISSAVQLHPLQLRNVNSSVHCVAGRKT